MKILVFVLILSFIHFIADIQTSYGEEANLKLDTKKYLRYPQAVKKTNNFVFVLKRSPETGLIVHEKMELDFFEGFAEDVLYLLPLQMVDVIAGDINKYNYFISRSRFNIKYNYWEGIAYNLYSESRFESRFHNIFKSLVDYKKSTELNNEIRGNSLAVNLLAEDFSETIKYLVEYINSYVTDGTGETMEYRLNQFIKSRPRNYLVMYNGYNGATVPDVINKINKLKCSKVYNEQMYTDLVGLTADLWCALWKSAGYDDFVSVKQSFFVKSVPLDLKAQLDLSSKIKDFTELSILLNRDVRFPDAYKIKLIEKRIDDYVVESMNLDLARSESLFLNKLLGKVEPIIVLKSQYIYEAVKYQQSLFH
jgi:hypothetical protein